MSGHYTNYTRGDQSGHSRSVRSISPHRDEDYMRSSLSRTTNRHVESRGDLRLGANHRRGDDRRQDSAKYNNPYNRSFRYHKAMTERTQARAKSKAMSSDLQPLLTCFYWSTYGKCTKSDEDCIYAHYDTGMVAEAPSRAGDNKKASRASQTAQQELVQLQEELSYLDEQLRRRKDELHDRNGDLQDAKEELFSLDEKFRTHQSELHDLEDKIRGRKEEIVNLNTKVRCHKGLVTYEQGCFEAPESNHVHTADWVACDNTLAARAVSLDIREATLESREAHICAVQQSVCEEIGGKAFEVIGSIQRAREDIRNAMRVATHRSQQLRLEEHVFNTARGHVGNGRTTGSIAIDALIGETQALYNTLGEIEVDLAHKVHHTTEHELE